MTKSKDENTDKGSILSAEELEILKGMQRGISHEGLAAEFGVSKWSIKFRLNSIKEKIDALAQTMAIKSAISQGLVPPLKKWSSVADGLVKLKAGIVGGGRGGSSMIDLLKHDPTIEICWIFDKDPDAVGLMHAKHLDIKILESFADIEDNPVHIVLNLTGTIEAGEELKAILDDETELMGGASAKLLWRLVDERRKRLEEKERVLKEREIFFHLGLLMEKIDNMKDAGFAIVDYATRLAGMPAGAIALFDDTTEEMHLIASKGLGTEFEKCETWAISDCDISTMILGRNASDPIIIDDLSKSDYAASHFINARVKSIMAAPLMSDQRVIGILYVTDFDEKIFLKEDIKIFSLLCIYSSLTIVKVKVIETMRHLSITDGLTGLTNQRNLMEHLEMEFQRSQRHDHPLSVIMIDIDHFKNYNDSYGHLEGNKCLKHISALLTSTTRKTDTVARFGGEEFCLMLVEVDKAGAHTFAQRLIEKIEAYPMPNQTVTVSAGVAAYPEDANTHIELLNKADVNLYKAKEWGRNRVCS